MEVRILPAEFYTDVSMNTDEAGLLVGGGADSSSDVLNICTLHHTTPPSKSVGTQSPSHHHDHKVS